MSKKVLELLDVEMLAIAGLMATRMMCYFYLENKKRDNIAAWFERVYQ